MATYTINPIGGGQSSGCADWIHNIYIPTLFVVGDFAYVQSDAIQKGKLTKICIKKIFVSDVVAYKDTTNEMWLENELASQSDAITLAEQYFINLTWQLAKVNPC